jgi:hypothetical protein
MPKNWSSPHYRSPSNRSSTLSETRSSSENFLLATSSSLNRLRIVVRQFLPSGRSTIVSRSFFRSHSDVISFDQTELLPLSLYYVANQMSQIALVDMCLCDLRRGYIIFISTAMAQLVECS